MMSFLTETLISQCELLFVVFFLLVLEFVYIASAEKERRVTVEGKGVISRFF
jgi:hypothetical protein